MNNTPTAKFRNNEIALFERSVSLHVLHFLDVTDLCPLRTASTTCCVTVERSREMKELRQLFASLRDGTGDVIECAKSSLYPLPPYLQSPVWRGILTASVSNNTLTVLRNIICLRAVQEAVWQNRHIVNDMCSNRRLIHESLVECPHDNFVLVPTTPSNHIMIYHGILIGLAGSLYAGRVVHFKLELFVTDPYMLLGLGYDYYRYPFKPPTVYFIAHSSTLAHCVPMCKGTMSEHWNPTVQLNKLVQSFSSELFNSDFEQFEHFEHFMYPLSSNIENIMADPTIPSIISRTYHSRVSTRACR